MHGESEAYEGIEIIRQGQAKKHQYDHRQLQPAVHSQLPEERILYSGFTDKAAYHPGKAKYQRTVTGSDSIQL